MHAHVHEPGGHPPTTPLPSLSPLLWVCRRYAAEVKRDAEAFAASEKQKKIDHLASEHSAYTGYTPLYLAVESGADGKIAKLLLDRGANVNTPVSVHRRRPS